MNLHTVFILTIDHLKVEPESTRLYNVLPSMVFTLPPLPVCTETETTLKDLIIVTTMLSAAPNNKCNPNRIFSKVNFVMTDSTAHNLGVVVLVAKDLENPTCSPTLLCNGHLFRIMQSKIKELCHQINDGIGKKQIL